VPEVLTPGAPPPLDPQEAARSRQLASRVTDRIEANGGWLPFREFMQAALYEPELGYYASGTAIFGAAGDFVTAPELSPLFAACLAHAVDAVLPVPDGEVLEFGAGSGRLAAELVAALARIDRAPRRYRIVEPSPALRERQRRLLEGMPRAATTFEWLDAPPRDGWSGVAIANEVLDALPVDRFRVTPAGVDAMGVVAADGAFAWQARAAGSALVHAVESLQQSLPSRLPAGYTSEIRPGQREWIARAVASLRRGVLFVVDYGLPRAQLYHPSRDGGTLCSFRRHRRTGDVLADPGTRDLTAWVDFSALSDDARAAGLEPAGFATQAHFLLENGIDRELERLATGASAAIAAAQRQVAATLLLPGEMGERFKVMALARGTHGPLRGFGFRDLSESL
jgi:SAM-dependent MidA family methyltransferase